ncbi:hypothetical protein G6O30_004341 [Shigella dysenteriae]|nr:hypothetical protein [Shigella dysenteriae]EFP8428277.1 hypothetical protein [Shigella dysenteriae]EFP8851944.1 hypothetical protein [Shigella dysenteriae]EJF5752491.1 hypothetical protein [Shigella sonnei]EKG0944222.1 hypothetical protein [Shigella dysenteriae]
MAIQQGFDMELADSTVVKDVKAVDTYDVAAALHHEAILKLMGVLKEAISTIAGVTTDEVAKSALESLVEQLPEAPQ